MPFTTSMASGGWTWAPKLLQGSGVCPQQVPEGLDVPSPWSWDHSQAGDLSAELSIQEPLPGETGQQLERSHHSPDSIHPSIHPGHHEDEGTLCTGKGGANKAHHQLLKAGRSHLYWPFTGQEMRQYLGTQPLCAPREEKSETVSEPRLGKIPSEFRVASFTL